MPSTGDQWISVTDGRDKACRACMFKMARNKALRGRLRERDGGWPLIAKISGNGSIR